MVVQKRSGFRIVLLEPTKSWLATKTCGGCGKAREQWISKRLRYNTCCTKCTTFMNVNYRIFGWQEMRERIFKRDHYTCKLCGFKAEEIKDANYPRIIKTKESQLDADHIIPISLGGEEWEMNNIQTLCKPCHKLKTKKDIKKISIERKVSIDQQRLV